MRNSKFQWPHLIAALVLFLAVFVGSLVLFPGWRQSPSSLAELAVRVIVGVFAFLATVRALLGRLAARTKKPAVDDGATTIIQQDASMGDRRVINTAGGDYYEGVPAAPDINAAALPQAVPGPAGALPASGAARFVERGAIMDDLRHALGSRTAAAIVGVGGMGGVGKTELARFLAAEIEVRWPGTVVWITVADRSLSDVHGEMARALGIALSPTMTDRDRALALRAALQQSPRVVVFDDIRAAFARHLPVCLPAAPPCAVLITSRLHELPGLPAGAIRLLDLMTEPQALALLGGVPGLAGVVAREAEAAKALCRLCAYHPLALDLAARRLLRRLRDSIYPIAFFNKNLSDRLAQLAYGEGPLESLSANFELSYLELSAADQGSFRRLAVFAAPGFLPQAAAALWGQGEAEARNVLESLENLSLVLPGETPGRFRLHDLLADFARGKLTGAGEVEAAHRAHGEFLLALFSQHATGDLSTAPEVGAELDNLGALANWACSRKDGEMLARLATVPSNWFFIVFHTAWDEWVAWLVTCLQLGVKDRRLQANVRKALGDVQQFRQETDAALASYQQALGLYRAVGARLGEANVLKALGDVQQFRKETDAALASYQQALGLYRAVGARLGEANVLKALGFEALSQGAFAQSLEYLQQAQVLYDQIGDKYSQARNLLAGAEAQFKLGNTLEALIALGRSARLADSIGMPPLRLAALEALGEISKLSGNWTVLNDLLRELLTAHPDDVGLLLRQADLYYAQKDFDRALSEYRGLTARALGGAAAWAGLGNVLSALKRYADAAHAYTQAIALQPEEPWLYRNRAEMWLELNQLEEAERDISEAARLDPEHAYTHGRQGYLALARGQFADAQGFFNYAAGRDDSVS